LSMITFKKDIYNFTYRVVGVIFDGSGRALLHRAESDNFWALPGGRCEFLEESQKTIVREMQEELELDVVVIRPLWFVENFFEYGGFKCHELGIYYLLKPSGHARVLDIEEGTHESYDTGTKLIFKWFGRDAIQDADLYPRFLRKALLCPPDTLTHVVNRDDEK